MIINLYKINPDNSYGGMEESYSEVDIDIANYTPPVGFTFKAPNNDTDIWDGNNWVAPYVPTLEELKEIKKAEIAAARYEAEIAGVIGIKTDRESQALLTAACLQAVIDPTYTLNWKTIDGSFVELTAEDIKAIGTTVRTHVQAQFDREKTLLEQVNAATTAEELEVITWTSV